MEGRASVLIVGGGIVGTALAWQLAERGVGDVVVVDLDLAGVYASSELNAGGARATWWQRVNVETCRVTLDLFREHATQLGFREKGYMWLYDDRELLARARRFQALQNEQGLGVELLEPGEVAERFPVVDRHLEELVGATFSPRDGLVNPNAVRQHYRERAEAGGVRFLDREYVVGVRTAREVGPAGRLRRVVAVDALRIGRLDPADDSGRLREILTAHRVPPDLVEGEVRIEADAVVSCLGAWSPLLSAKLGLPDATLPLRRQLALVDVHREDRAPGVDFEALGMIVDPSGIYYHPEGPHVLAGFSIPDEPPGYDFDYDGDLFFEEEIWPRLAHRASSFERCGHVRGWAGLYAATPDRSGIAGAVPGFANLFEAHSFTGRGVMQSYGVARDVAALVDTGRFEHVDLAPLARDRFGDPSRLVMEDLHI
ncbi:MAG: FAD-binding oxidoreductase [Myxococcota bacterium]|nr:FAD-binding oxidoreductase [Myxococcota bacterium]